MKTLILVLLLAASVAQAETFKWTDNEGTVHFTDTPGEIPAPYRNSAAPLGMDAAVTANGAKAASSAGIGSIAPQVETLKERMQGDEGTMALIRALQNDPQMQALLNDPEVLRAVQAGDFAALINNPRFMELLSNPRVQEIGNRMQQGGTR